MPMKIFASGVYEDLERVVNAWLAEHPTIAVTHVDQLADRGRLVLTVFYTDAPQGADTSFRPI